MTANLEKRLHKRTILGNIRNLQIASYPIDFSSNDYLGLARSQTLAEATLQEWRKNSSLLNGLGSTGSRLLSGNSTYAQSLEEKIAAFHNMPAALLFSCGYMANVGLLSTVASATDTVFFDQNIHASLHDGIRLSKAHAFAFKHNDLEHLRKRLQNSSTQGNRFICVESIYSTDGSLAPLAAISKLAKEYDALLIVDEAHAIGACGPKGRALVAELGLETSVFAEVITFGKALGTYGAAILGSSTLKQSLINFATSYIYTTALPHHVLAAIHCCYELFPQQEEERKALQALICHFRTLFSSPSSTHIQFIPICGNEPAKKTAARLNQQGFAIRPLMSPTVQRGREGLRLSLHSFNQEEEITRLYKSLFHE